MKLNRLTTYFGEIKPLLKNFKAKGFFHLLSANFLIQIFGFGSQFLVAWVLSPEEIGQIKVMQTYLNLAVLIASLGFNTSTLKLCSEKRPEGEIVFLYKQAFKYTAIALLFVWPFLIILSRLHIISTDPDINKYFPYYSIALIPLTFNGLYFSYLQARKKIKEIAKIQVLTKIVALILIVVLTYLLSMRGYLMAVVIGYTLTFLLYYKRIISINKNIQLVNINKVLRTHWDYAKFSFLTNVLGQISSYSDVFLMNYMVLNKGDVGYYSFGLTMILASRMFSSTVQQIMAPYLSEKSNNVFELKVTYRKYNRLYILSSSFIAIISFFILPYLVELIFSGKYSDSIPFFRILLLAWFIQNLYSIKGITLFGIGKINYNFYSSSLVTVSSLGITYLMITKHGIMGAAYGKVITNIVTLVITNIFFNKGMKKYAKDNQTF